MRISRRMGIRAGQAAEASNGKGADGGTTGALGNPACTDGRHLNGI